MHIKRIDNMLNNEVTISDRDFSYAEDFLASQTYTGQTATRFAKLYNIKACMYRDKAKLHAEMIKAYPDDWYALSYYADFYAGIAQYDKALDLYEKSITMQSSPKLIDNYLCIAHIYEIKKNPTKAIEAYERIIDILVNEHDLDVNGTAVCRYKNKIESLQTKA